MPFTLSHAAVALPFRRFKPIWPALVIGTFAPDLQYFIWISDEDRSGHHFPQVVLFTLPLALIALWIFEWIVKGAVIELLPSALQRRLQDKIEPLSFWGWKRLGSILLWMAIGIATLLCWDEFTHRYTWTSDRLSVLRVVVPVPFVHTMSVLKILQHASSVLGLLFLGVWFVIWWFRTPPAPRSQKHEFPPWVKVVLVVAFATIAIICGYWVATSKLADHELPTNPLFVVATIFEAITSVLCLELVIYGLALNVNPRYRRLPTVQPEEPGG